MAIPVILKGDTSAKISLNVADGWDFSAVVLEVGFCGTVTTIVEPVAGSVIEVAFTAEQSARFPLGTHKVTMVLRNDEGGRCTLPWGKIKVTDAPGEVYDAAISVDPGTIAVEDATAADSLGDVKAKLNKVLDYLRGVTVGLMVALALPCFGAGVQTATLNDLPGTAQVVTSVDGFATADDLAAKRDKADMAEYVLTDWRITAVSEGEDIANYTIDLMYDEYWLIAYKGRLCGQVPLTHSGTDFICNAEVTDDPNADYPVFRQVFITCRRDLIKTGDRLATTGEVAAVAATIPQTVTNVVRDVQGLVWDEKLGITWKQTMYDGNLYYVAVTNANITEVK